MNNAISIRKEDQILMTLVHYFVTKENYAPILVQGVKDEIWLEKLDGPYRVIRINSNYIHNEEQYRFDQFKVKDILRQIKKRTLSLSVNALNIYLNANESVKTEYVKNIDNIEIHEIKEIESNKLFSEIFPKLKDNLEINASSIEMLFSVTNDINAKTKKDNQVFEKIFSKKKPIITYTLIVICTLVFLIESFLGGSTNSYTLLFLGANSKRLIVAGEIYRLFTYAFLHAGIIHLLCNMYSLYIIGSEIESHFGKAKYLFIYILSAIGGGLLSAAFSSSLSVGASGAIFGLLGSMLYFGLKYRLYLKDTIRSRIVPVIIINLAIGFLISGIDNAGHIGGLIYGFLSSMIVGIPENKNNKDQINGIIMTIIFTLFLGYLIFFR